MKKLIIMKSYMRKINQNTSFILVAVVLFIISSCIDNYHRVEINKIVLGDKIADNQFLVLNDYKNLDFPFKEVMLKSDSNIVLKVIGPNNVIYEMKEFNLSGGEHRELIKSITNALSVEADSSIDKVISNMWYCNMYVWHDTRSYDQITLSNCVHKSKEIRVEEGWELTVINDTLRNALDAKYNYSH